MKTTIKVLGLMSMFFVFTGLAAAADLKVGIVDLQKALSQTKNGAKAQKDFEAEIKSLQTNVDGKKGEYDKALADFNKQKDSLNAKARQEKEDQIIKLEKDWKRDVNDAQEQIRRKNTQIIGEFGQKLRAAVQTVGKEEGYTLVVEKNITLYAVDGIDVTDKVVKKFDEVNK
ncbi:MAG: OmpH family outer membrane protein [Deltaproteobacteria bacterium]|nr:OmpH family outer membrane protein [Deltaproteobacteria bacterium]